jgi:hypothetical protein
MSEYLRCPTGYVRDDASTISVRAACAVSPSSFSGSTKRAIESGTHYVNLKSYVASWLATKDPVISRRKLIDCGNDGRVLTPLAQQTGICDGCSFGEAAFTAWCANYVATGVGPRPREVSFIWPYLAGRILSITGYGDSGACPPYSAQAYHDLGVLPVDCGGRYNLVDLPPHGPRSQEELCVQMRDNPRLLDEWKAAAQGLECRVFNPQDMWTIADCVTTLRPVTFGSSGQMVEARPGSNGVSQIYDLHGGHETFAEGWFTLNGRLGFIKMESWWNASGYPGSQYHNNRVEISTDEGKKLLYPGQGAIWADEWMHWSPECWAIDTPGSR